MGDSNNTYLSDFFQKAVSEVGSNTELSICNFFKKELYIPVDQRYFYCIFMTHVEVNLREKSLNGSIQFHYVMKYCKTPNVTTFSQTLLFVCFFVGIY